MKITVIGAGSTYTPELILGFLSRLEGLPTPAHTCPEPQVLGNRRCWVDELWLMDIDAARLEIVGSFAARMVASRGDPFKVILSGDRREALRGANYVITQLRVGQMSARVADEYLAHRHGLIGQETTGVGGMSKALRTIPVILEIANEVGELAPGALLVNFTNPSGLVTEALQRYAPQVASVGVCNVAHNTKMALIRGMAARLGKEINPAQVELKTLGLNHLSWHTGLTVDGEDAWPLVLAGYVELLRLDSRGEASRRALPKRGAKSAGERAGRAEARPEWPPETIEALHMIPNDYLKYYYDTPSRLADQQKWPPSRGEEVLAIEKELLTLYADPALDAPPPSLLKRGGAYYSTVAAQLIASHWGNLGETHVANVRHEGAVPGWPVDWVLEMPCRVDRLGVHPLPAEPLPPVCFGLLAQVKAYELLTVEAAVHGDRRAAYQALLAHPLGPPAGQVEAVLFDGADRHDDQRPGALRVLQLRPTHLGPKDLAFHMPLLSGTCRAPRYPTRSPAGRLASRSNDRAG